MNRRSILSLSAARLCWGVVHAGAQNPPKLVNEEFMVPSQQDGIQLYVRNKHSDNMNVFTPERTVLFVHGATYPSETSFDLPVGGASWMDQIASRGFDVYLVDLPGYGKSTRPPEMDQPADTSGPIVDTEVAVAAVGNAVDFILRRRNIPRTNLIGWSWGTTIMAKYTTQNAPKVQRLALYAPVWVFNPTISTVPKLAAYRAVQRQMAHDRWLREGTRRQKGEPNSSWRV